MKGDDLVGERDRLLEPEGHDDDATALLFHRRDGCGGRLVEGSIGDEQSVGLAQVGQLLAGVGECTSDVGAA